MNNIGDCPSDFGPEFDAADLAAAQRATGKRTGADVSPLAQAVARLQQPPRVYPLYCVDRQDRVSIEKQYRGPYDTHDEAHEHADPGDLVRRCRRVRATEIHGWETVLGNFMEQLDERAASGELPDGVWGDVENTIVKDQRDDLVDAVRALLDEHVCVDLYICEGDE